MANVVGYAETKAIQGFLTYLNKHYSNRINPKDTYLIAAIAAWFRQESGSLSRVIGNNPFNIRVSPLQSGYRIMPGNGKFAVFSSMERGFAAAAYLLMHGAKAYGYQTAINALKRGGNQAAVDFLAAIAMSSWSADHYGAANWTEAYSKTQNHVLRNYVWITGVQLVDPAPYGRHKSGPDKGKPKPKPAPPRLPRDLKYAENTRVYIDPWAAGNLYQSRHRAGTKLDGGRRNR